jgi:hypothetical protein
MKPKPQTSKRKREAKSTFEQMMILSTKWEHASRHLSSHAQVCESEFATQIVTLGLDPKNRLPVLNFCAKRLGDPKNAFRWQWQVVICRIAYENPDLDVSECWTFPPDIETLQQVDAEGEYAGLNQQDGFGTFDLPRLTTEWLAYCKRQDIWIAVR